MHALARVAARPMARSFNRAFASEPKIRIGTKIGVGVRHRLPKTAGRFKAGELADEGDMSDHYKYWRGVMPELDKYNDDALKIYRSEFRQYAVMDKIQLSTFQRLVKAKCENAKIDKSVLPTLTYELWSQFDQDVGNFVDFGEFVAHYPSMSRSILRKIFQNDADEIFQTHSKGGKLDMEGLNSIITQYGCGPLSEPDLAELMNKLAGQPADLSPVATTVTLDDAHAWSGNFASAAGQSLFAGFE